METLKQAYATLLTESFKSLMVSIACANMQSAPKKSLGRLFATARTNSWIPARTALAVVATQTHIIFNWEEGWRFFPPSEKQIMESLQSPQDIDDWKLTFSTTIAYEDNPLHASVTVDLNDGQITATGNPNLQEYLRLVLKSWEELDPE